MRKYLLSVFFILLSFGSFFYFRPTAVAQEETTVNLYLFHSETCPHCLAEREYLKELSAEYGGKLVISQYEVTSNSDNRSLYKKLEDLYDVKAQYVPMTIVGDKVTIGFGSKETTGQEIKDQIDFCLTNVCSDKLGDYLASAEPTTSEEEAKSNQSVPEEIKLPLFGTVKTQAVSLPLLTVLFGLVDGFNPCAMWALVYLISLLLPMQNKKRMWLLGGIFILVSGVVYFFFMAAWLNFFVFLGYINFVRLIIGLLAVGVSVYNFREWYLNRPGCKVTRSQSRLQFFDRLKAITQKPSLWLALGGIAVLAFSVNMVEAFCSLGLPAIYTKILSLSDLSQLQYYLYIVGYVFFFMLDDLIVFIVAMVTLRTVSASHKYTHLSQLIGGILLLILGLLLIFKPAWLAFS